MVKIFNIVSDGNFLSCSYTPEDSEEKGTITIDINTRETVNIIYSKYECVKETYAHFARLKLIDLLDSGKPFPDSAIAMWY